VQQCDEDEEKEDKFFSFFQVMEHRWNETDRENRSTREKTCLSATLFTTNNTWTDSGIFWAGFFSCPVFSLIHFVPLSPSLLLHVTYVPYYCPYTTNTTQTSMPPAGFEPKIPASERPQTHALDRAATGIGNRTRASAVTGWRLTA
jgi:hypothetical protein